MRFVAILILLLTITACATAACGKCDVPTGGLKRASYAMTATVDDVPFGTLLTCDSKSGVSMLTNTGSAAIVVTSIDFLDQTNGYFSLTRPTLPDTLQPGESLRIPVTFAPRSSGAFKAKIIYHVTNLDGSFVIGEFTSNLTGEGETITAHAHINRDYRAYPGTILDIAVTLDDNLDSANITELLFYIRFNDSVMALNNVTAEKIQAMLKGTLLEGWAIDVISLNDTSFAIMLTAPAGTSLKGNGMLLNLEFLTFVGNGMHSELPFDIILPNRPCATVITLPGYMTVDSLGIMGFFPVWPNPALSSFNVKFLLGEPQTVTLKLIASDGSLVAIPIDRRSYRPGIYTEPFSSEGLAPGAYTLVMHTEREEQIQRFVVLK